MKSFLSFISMIILAALISSCQKEASQVPAAKTPATAMQINSLAVVPTSGLAYTVNLGMIDFYPFHGNANDVSGHGHNGQPIGAGVPPDYVTFYPPPALTANKYGIANEAYKFNGLDGEIDIPGVIFDNKKTQTQFCFYARYKGDGWGALVSNGQIGNWEPDEPGFSLRANQGGGTTFVWNDYFFADGQLSAVINSGPLAPSCKNSWVDVAVNFSNSVLTMYINGQQVATATSPFTGPAHFDPNLLIGSEINRYPTNFFNSSIDEVRIYNRPLTTDEISYLYAH